MCIPLWLVIFSVVQYVIVKRLCEAMDEKQRKYDQKLRDIRQQRPLTSHQ
jgi:hypothetical protein